MLGAAVSERDVVAAMMSMMVARVHHFLIAAKVAGIADVAVDLHLLLHLASLATAFHPQGFLVKPAKSNVKCCDC